MNAWELYERTRQPWGGATVRQSDGWLVPDGTDAYAVAVTDTVSIPDTASYEQFVSAYDQSRAQFADAPYIGIFHDDMLNVIEFNGVTICPDTPCVDDLHKHGVPMPGGAYHFASGNGYWPAGRPVQYAPQSA